MNREQLELLLFKLSLVDKHIKSFFNMLYYQVSSLDKPEKELDESENQSLIYELDKLEKLCGLFFTDAFTIKQIAQLRNDEIMKEIHKELEKSQGEDDGV